MLTKTKGSIVVQRRDGTTYDLEKEGIHVISFDPPSSNFQHTYTQIGKYGAELSDTQIQQTTIPIVFDVSSRDNYDYELQRMKVMRIFSSSEPFYIINMRMPYMRWKVVAEAFSYPRLNNYWKAKSVSINLVCYDGLAESTATTLDSFDISGNKYGIGMGIPFETPIYTFTNQPAFNFYNPSVIPLLASERPVTVLVQAYAPQGITIKNTTTGQSFTYHHALTKNDAFELRGLIPVVNGIQRFGNDWSDRSFVDYAIGNNAMQLKGSSDFTISFLTRFYY